MKSRRKIMRDLVRKTIVFLVLGFFITSGANVLFFNKTIISISKASSEDIAWDATLRITESGGSGIEVVFGEASDASDGWDVYDWAAPPYQPELPYIIAKFNTTIDEPLNYLLHEYKQYPSDCKEWNLMILWQPEFGNDSLSTITISWDALKLVESEYSSVDLYKDNTGVSDMLTETSYTFDCPPSTLQQFKIVCQSKKSDSNETPFLPITFILVTIVLFTLYWKKNN